MNNGNDGIVPQQKRIKRWDIAGTIGLLLIGLSAVIFTVSMVQMAANLESEYPIRECGSDCSDFSNNEVSELIKEDKLDNALFSNNEISELIKQDKLDNALVLIYKRLITHPNDAYAHWYKARIHVLKKEWKEAQKHVEKMEVLAPSWEKKYIKPLRNKIKELSE